MHSETAKSANMTPSPPPKKKKLNDFLESIPELLKSLKIPVLNSVFIVVTRWSPQDLIAGAYIRVCHFVISFLIFHLG
jgi:hypothetical protein